MVLFLFCLGPILTITRFYVKVYVWDDPKSSIWPTRIARNLRRVFKKVAKLVITTDFSRSGSTFIIKTTSYLVLYMNKMNQE